MRILAVCLLTGSAMLAQTSPLEDAIEAARGGPSSPDLKPRIVKAVTGQQGVAVWGQDYLFVANSPSPVIVSIDQQPPVPLAQIPGSDTWMLLAKMRTGVTHSYQFQSGGKPLGARGDAVGYNPDSYPKPGTPKGKLSDKQTIVSRIF